MSIAPAASATRRAIGIVRVSQVKGREGESFASPGQQRDRIRAACERDGLVLLDVVEELDVSGGRPLAARPGLSRAVAAVEAGEADVIVAAYFDRLVRSLRVQDELVTRVESAGGQVLAIDVGRVTNGSAGQWLSGTMLGAVAEYARRNAKERSGEAQARAVARGAMPWPNVPPGYLRGDDGALEPDPATREIVVEAFRLRAAGHTIKDVRAYLGEHGVDRSHHGVGSLLASRVMLGEIHFGELVNLKAHEPIVNVGVWRAVQRMKVSRGRRAKSERPLARLGTLRCGTCGARLVVGTSNNGAYPLYRCPPTGDCTRRMTISAELVEGVVIDAVKARIADARGRASAEVNVQQAEQALDSAQADLDAAIRAFAALSGEVAAIERLDELRAARDHAQERVDQLGSTRAAVTVSAFKDWDLLTLDERRALIRATIDRVTITPGRGLERIKVDLLGE